jgi:hypothetical protein
VKMYHLMINFLAFLMIFAPFPAHLYPEKYKIGTIVRFYYEEFEIFEIYWKNGHKYYSIRTLDRWKYQWDRTEEDIDEAIEYGKKRAEKY